MNMLGNVDNMEMKTPPHYYRETLIKYHYRYAGKYQHNEVRT